jgi:hypothetical protein
MPRLLELLRPARGPGYPGDYLLARLARRRIYWLESCPPGSGDEARHKLEQELDWLQEQLEPELRGQLAPALLFFELPALLAALRHNEAGDHRGALACLARSRLSREIRQILARERPYPQTLQELGERLTPLGASMAGLARIRREMGRAGLEQALWSGLLEAGRREQRRGPVRDFIDQLADRQERLRLAKAERWPGKVALPQRPGHLSHPHRVKSGEPAALDHRLLTGMFRDWQQRRRSGGRLEQLLDYLWTIYLATRNCGVRHLTELLGEDRAARETISAR